MSAILLCYIANQKVDKYHIKTKFSKYNSFQVISNLLNRENLKSNYYSAMQRATSLEFHYVIADPKIGE